MAVKKEAVAESISELSKLTKLMGDGQFEPFHWAGDPIISQVLTDLASVKEIEGQGMMIGMMTVVKMMLKKKEDETESFTKQMLAETANHAAVLFLAGYRLGRKDAEVAELERML